MERWVFGTDLHGDMQDKPTVKAFLSFVADFKPHHKIFGGDLVDIRPLRAGASPEEKSESMKPDIEAGHTFLRAFKPHIWIKGNHEDRLDATVGGLDGVASDHASELLQTFLEASRAQRTRILPYDRTKGVYKYGNYRFIHGMTCGPSAAKQAASTYGNVIMGHVHQHQAVRLAALDEVYGYSSAALCKTRMSYNKRILSSFAHSNGWMYGYKTSSGKLIVLQAKQIDGKWITPTV